MRNKKNYFIFLAIVFTGAVSFYFLSENVAADTSCINQKPVLSEVEGRATSTIRIKIKNVDNEDNCLGSTFDFLATEYKAGVNYSVAVEPIFLYPQEEKIISLPVLGPSAPSASLLLSSYNRSDIRTYVTSFFDFISLDLKPVFPTDDRDKNWEVGLNHKVDWESLNFPVDGKISLELFNASKNYLLVENIPNSNTYNLSLGSTDVNGLDISPGVYSLKIVCTLASNQYCVDLLRADGSADNGEALISNIKITLSIPGAPVVTATAGSPGSNTVSLSWQNVPGATSYKIYRGDSAGFTLVNPIGTVSTNSYSDTGAVARDRAYYYIVKSSNVSGDSVSSNEVSIISTPPPPALSIKPSPQPPNGSAPANSLVEFLDFELTARDSDVNVNSFTIEKTGEAPRSVFLSLVIEDGTGQRLGLGNFSTNGNSAIVSAPLTIKGNTTKRIKVFGNMATDLTANSGQSVSLRLIDLDTSVSVDRTSLPITGATHRIEALLNPIDPLPPTLGLPTLSVDKSILNFDTVVKGTILDPQSFRISSVCEQTLCDTLNWRISPLEGISISRLTGEGPTTVSVTPDTSILGPVNKKIEIFSNGGSKDIALLMNVVGNRDLPPPEDPVRDTINSSMDKAIVSLIGGKSVSEFNSVEQKLSASFDNEETKENYGSLEVLFDKGSMYRFKGHPHMQFETIYPHELVTITQNGPIASVPQGLESLTDYYFGVLMLSDSGYDLLKKNVSMNLTFKNVSDISKWQNAKLYQYYCTDEDLFTDNCLRFVWKPVSQTPQILGNQVTFNAFTKDPALGIFGVLGR